MRVLLIEDEHKFATAIKKGLMGERYAVDVEYDFESGLGSALSEPYDAIIIDRMLPGGDGLDIARQLRTEGIHTPSLILTARGSTDERVEGLDSGADDYLVKPFSFEELLARLRALLRRPKKAEQTILRASDLSLNTVTFEVTRAKKPIDLSAKEFSLLEYLMRHKGTTMSKESIISHVWDFDADILPNTVEVYIGYLRSKIDKPFRGKDLIHTKRGFGYRLGIA